MKLRGRRRIAEPLGPRQRGGASESSGLPFLAAERPPPARLDVALRERHRHGGGAGEGGVRARPAAARLCLLPC